MQQAASDTHATMEQVIAPLHHTINNLHHRLETTQRHQKLCNIILTGYQPDASITPSQMTAEVTNLLEVHAAPDKTFTILSAAPFGYRNQGPRPVRIVFQSEEDKHAAFSTSKGLRSDRIFLDDDLTASQQQERKTLLPTRNMLKDSHLRPFWRGGILKCADNQGNMKTYKAADVIPPPATYPRHPASRVRRSTHPTPTPSAALAAATAAASAAIGIPEATAPLGPSHPNPTPTMTPNPTFNPTPTPTPNPTPTSTPTLNDAATAPILSVACVQESPAIASDAIVADAPDTASTHTVTSTSAPDPVASAPDPNDTSSAASVPTTTTSAHASSTDATTAAHHPVPPLTDPDPPASAHNQ